MSLEAEALMRLSDEKALRAGRRQAYKPHGNTG